METREDLVEGRPHFGSFDLGEGRQIAGELSLDGEDTSLLLQDSSFFSTRDLDVISGVLGDRRRVSLLHCVPRVSSGHSTRNGEALNLERVFPHFVTIGDCHINAVDRAIVGVAVVLKDSTRIFNDSDAFGALV